MGIATLINMQGGTNGKNNMQEQMDNIRIEMDILRKKKNDARDKKKEQCK